MKAHASTIPARKGLHSQKLKKFKVKWVLWGVSAVILCVLVFTASSAMQVTTKLQADLAVSLPSSQSKFVRSKRREGVKKPGGGEAPISKALHLEVASAKEAAARTPQKIQDATKRSTDVDGYLMNDIAEDGEVEEFLRNLEKLDGMTPSLKVLLQAALSRNQDVHDGEIDPVIEEERCKRYMYTLNTSKPLKRRRIFWGSLLADDSWHVLAMNAMESHGILHTAAFVESNTTQSLRNRTLRFPLDSLRTQLLQSPLLWGNNTKVHVDYYLEDADPFFLTRGLWRENDQRDRIFSRWKANGMRPDDIGYLSDVDEIATRDFLRALQICEIPSFRTPHDCLKDTKITTTTVVFEGSPKCLQIPRRWNHPNFVAGECIAGIGNQTQHPPVPREQKGGANMRVKGWAFRKEAKEAGAGPLWDATDFRMEKHGSIKASGSTPVVGKNQLRTGFHFHNFFDSMEILRRKYKTYGHPIEEAYTRSLTDIQPNDLGFMVDCLTGRRESGSKWAQPKIGNEWDGLDPTYGLPVAFLKAPEYAELRHREFQAELAMDEKLHPPTLRQGI